MSGESARVLPGSGPAIGPSVAPSGPEPGYGDSIELRPFAWDEGQKAYEAYSSWPAIRRSIDIRKDSLSKLPLCIYEGDGEEEREIERARGNIVDIWQRSDPRGLVEELQASLDLVGTGYLAIEENNAREVTGFYTLPAHRTRAILTKDRREVAHYQLAHQGKVYKFAPDELLVVREYSPGLQLTGIAPFRAAAASYSAGMLTQALQTEMVRRGGEFASVLTSPEARGAINDPAKQRRLQLRFKKRYRTPIGKRSVISLPPGTKLEKTQLTPKELMLTDLSKMSREQAYEVHGIPLWLVGLQGGDNLGAGGAARSAERMFWEYTMDALKGRMEWALTIGLLQRFNESWHCRFDTSGVYCLQVAFLERAELVQKACGRAVLTVNEGRAILGEPALDDPKWDELQELPAPGAFGADSSKPGTEDPGAGAAGKPEPDPPKKKPKKQPAYSARIGPERRHHLKKAMDREAKHALTYVVRLFDQQESRAVARANVERSAQRVVDVTNLLTESPEDRQLMEQMIDDLVARRGDDALNELIKGADFKGTGARVRSYITQQSNRVLANTTETTQQLFNERLQEWAGESTEGLVALIRGVFDDRRENAVTIARTESASAFNFATLEAWKQTDGMVKGKRWVAVDDENTRPEHAEADGQEVGLEEPFRVGDGLLDFPGDPNADPDLTINCRCTVDFILAEERSVRQMLDFINRGMERAGVRTASPSRNGHARVAPALERS